MKAITYHRYGTPEVLQIEQLDKPTPNDDEVLIKTHATTVTSGDWRARSLEVPRGLGLVARLIFGVFKPRQPILGSELAGVVEAVSRNVTQFKVGDRVFVFTGARLGCYVEYKCMPANDNVVLIPDTFSFAEAAALSFGGTTVLDFFRKGKLKKGERVLINGASGCVGTTAIQLAKHMGAHVTGVSSGKNAELVESLGADEVIDYTKRDFSELGQKYDVVIDTVGTAPYFKSKKVLNPDGRLLLVMGGLSDMLRAPIVALTSKRRIVAGAAAERLDDMQQLAQLADAGKLKPVIDRQFAPEQIVEAHHYVDSGRKTGNVIINWQ